MKDREVSTDKIRMAENCLKVYIMGNVQLSYNDRPIVLGGVLSGKVLQLFLILLYFGEEGIGRDDLLDMLYGSGEYSNPANNLRAIVYRLRKALKDMLPPHEYIRTVGGVYRWDNGPTSLYVDAKDFKVTALQAMSEGNPEDLKRACELYKGEFLSQMASESWVTVEEVRYQEMYFNCLRLAYEKLWEKREYDSLLELCSRACELYPYEECQIMKLDCLIAMKRFRDAMELYQKVTRQYFDEQGLPPSEKMLERFRMMSSQIRYTSDTVNNVKESLIEQDAAHGPYYCTYPSFIDCYRLLARMSDRMKIENVLLCCTLLDSRKKPMDEDGEFIRAASEELRKAIASSLRKGDMFTCYSPSQYLIMLNGAAQEYSSRIFERIDQRLHRWSEGKKIHLNFQVIAGGIPGCLRENEGTGAITTL